MPAKQLSAKAILQSSDLFGNMDDCTLDQLVDNLKTTNFKAKEILFHQGDHVNGCYFILQGTVKISLFENDTDETLIAILGEGDIVGEMGVISRRKRSATATILKDCTLGYLSSNRFEELANANPEIYRSIIIVLCERLTATNQNFVNQKLALNERLARTLVNLANAFGDNLPDGRIRIIHKITQLQLAHMTNASRENINRQMSSWRDDNLLSQISGYYCLHNIDEWRKIAQMTSAIK